MKIHAENAESTRGNSLPPTTRGKMDGGKRCRKQACRLTALVGEYCEHHALQKHENMVNKPDLYMYLNESTHRSKLQSWFVQNDDTINVNRMLLWYAIHNFKSCSSPELRKSRSKTIYKKFLSETSKYRVRVHERVEELCLSSFEKYSFIPSEVLYQVQGAVFLSLERIFLNIYVSSQDFQVFAESQKDMILKTKFSKEDKAPLAFLGLAMITIFPNFMAAGLEYTTAARAGLLYATMPLCTILIAFFLI